MTWILRRYILEILLAVIGALGALLVALLVHRVADAIVLGVLSLVIAVSALGVRFDVEERAGNADRIGRVILTIRTARWRDDAIQEVDEAIVRYESWAGGSRRVSERQSLAYQIASLQGARWSVRAVHVVSDPDSLSMWSNPQRGFSRLVAAYQNLGDNVGVQRIMILDPDQWRTGEVDGRKVIGDKVLETVCRFQIRLRMDGGLGADLRLMWRPNNDRSLGDFLIVDEREVCSIERLGRGNFGDLEVSINAAQVRRYVNTFEAAWLQSSRAEEFLS